MSKSKIWIKIIAAPLLITFLSQDIVFAQGGLAGISVPKNLVSSQESYKAPQPNTQYPIPNTIINIQDAHASLNAQESIVSILNSLVTNYDLSVVAIEGSSGYIDTSLLKTFPDQKVRDSAAKDLMARGLMSAAELFSITSGKNIALYGIEDRALYKKNVEEFRRIYEMNESVRKDIDGLLYAVKGLKDKVYSPELRALEDSPAAGGDDTTAFKERWQSVRELATRIGADYRSYMSLSKFVKSLELEKRIDFDKANHERELLIGELSERSDKNGLEELMLKSVDFKMGRISVGEFYLFLGNISRKWGVETAKYRNLAAYAEYITLYESIDPISIFEEAKAFESAVREKLFSNDDQRRLYRLSRYAFSIKGLFEIKLTNEDFGYLKEDMGLLGSAGEIESLIKELSLKYKTRTARYCDLNNILSDIPEALKFYETARKRDSVILENTIKRMRQEGRNIAALVTGGFHTKGLTKLLKDKDTSYLIILPKFDSAKSERPYVTVLTNRKDRYESVLKSGQYYLATAAYFDADPAVPEEARLAKYGERFKEALADAVAGIEDHQGKSAKMKALVEQWAGNYRDLYEGFAAQDPGKRSEMRDPAGVEEFLRSLLTHPQKARPRQESKADFLVIGSSGFLGEAALAQLSKKHTALGTYHTTEKGELLQLDITNRRQVLDLFNSIRPKVVVHTAVLADVDYCEEHSAQAHKVIVNGARNVALACKAVGAKMVYISTDQVFDGENGPYSEEDSPSPVNVYGRTKLESEGVVKSLLDDYLIVRAPLILGLRSRFVMGLLKTVEAGGEAKLPVDIYANPVAAESLAEIIEELVSKGKVGIYHVGGAEYLNRYEIADRLADILKFDRSRLTACNSDDMHRKARRPKKGGLRTDKLKRELGLKEDIGWFTGPVGASRKNAYSAQLQPSGIKVPKEISDRYEIIKPYTTGGSSADTFLARDRQGRQVIVKHSTWAGVGSNGIPWLRAQYKRLKELKQSLGPEGAAMIPEVYEYHETNELAFYSMQYLEGGKPLPFYFLEHASGGAQPFLDDLESMIDQFCRHLYSRGNLEVPVDYVQKVHLARVDYRFGLLTKKEGDVYDKLISGRPFAIENARYDDISYMFEELSKAPVIRINGVDHTNLPRLISEVKADHGLIERLKPRSILKYAHGDLLLRNVMRMGDGNFRLFDVRGVDLPGNSPSRIDLTYELGKILHSFLLEIVRNNLFDISVRKEGGTFAFDIKYHTSKSAVANFLEVRRRLPEMLRNQPRLMELLKDEPLWLEKALFAEATHFITDAPNRLSQDPSGKHTLAYYAIGTQLLDEFLRSQRGRKGDTKLSGVSGEKAYPAGKALEGPYSETPGSPLPPIKGDMRSVKYISPAELWGLISELPVFHKMRRMPTGKGYARTHYHHTALVIRGVRALIKEDYGYLMRMTKEAMSGAAIKDGSKEAYFGVMKKVHDSLARAVKKDVRNSRVMDLIPMVHDIGKADIGAVVGGRKLDIFDHPERGAEIFEDAVIKELRSKGFEIPSYEKEFLRILIKNHFILADIYLADVKIRPFRDVQKAAGYIDDLLRDLDKAGIDFESFMAVLTANIAGDIAQGVLPVQVQIDQFNEMCKYADRQYFEAVRERLSKKTAAICGGVEKMGLSLKRGDVDVQGEAFIIDPAKVDISQEIDEGLRSRDMISRPMNVPGALPGGKVIEKYVDGAQDKENIVLAFSGTQGGFWDQTSLIIKGGEVIAKSAGARGLFQQEYVPLSGRFWVLSFDRDKRGVYEIGLRDGKPVSDLPIHNGIAGSPLLINGQSMMQELKFGVRPPRQGNDLLWPADQQMAFSAMGYNKDGKLVRIDLSGIPARDNEARIADVIDVLKDLGVTDAVLLGSSADVQTFQRDGKDKGISYTTWASARKKSDTKNLGERRPIGSCILVRRPLSGEKAYPAGNMKGSAAGGAKRREGSFAALKRTVKAAAAHIKIQGMLSKLYKECLGKFSGGNVVRDARDTKEYILDEIAKWRAQKRDGPFVIAIDGNSGSLKTTMAKELRSVLGSSGQKAEIVRVDWFLRDRYNDRYPKYADEMGRAATSVNWKRISLREEKFEQDVLEKLRRFRKSGEPEISLDLADLYAELNGGKLSLKQAVKITRDTVVIIEGNYALQDKWSDCYDLKALMLAKPASSAYRRASRDSIKAPEGFVRDVLQRISLPSYFDYLLTENIDPDIVAVTDSWKRAKRGKSGEKGYPAQGEPELPVWISRIPGMPWQESLDREGYYYDQAGGFIASKNSCMRERVLSYDGITIYKNSGVEVKNGLPKKVQDLADLLRVALLDVSKIIPQRGPPIPVHVIPYKPHLVGKTIVNGSVHLTLDQKFIETLIMYRDRYPRAIPWITAEKVAHELNHGNTMGTDKEEAMEERSNFIDVDMPLYRYLCAHPELKAEVDRFFDETGFRSRAKTFFKHFLDVHKDDAPSELRETAERFIDSFYSFSFKFHPAEKAIPAGEVSELAGVGKAYPAGDEGRALLKYPDPHASGLQLDDYDKAHYRWDAENNHWYREVVKGRRLILGTWEDVKRSQKEGAAPTDMEYHVVIRTNAGYSVYVFDSHSDSGEYLEEAVERADVSSSDNHQIFIDDHMDTQEIGDLDARIAKTIAEKGRLMHHIWVSFGRGRAGPEEPDEELEKLGLENRMCRSQDYFSVGTRPRRTKAIFNIDTDAAESRQIADFIKEVINKDGVIPSTVHISTSPPNCSERDMDRAASSFDGLLYPEGFGTIERCVDLSRALPQLIAESAAGEEKAGHRIVLKNIKVADAEFAVIDKEEIDAGLIAPQDIIFPDNKEENSEMEKSGEELLRSGRVGVITVAGGMAARAGINYPKGMHPIMPVTSRTLFEARADEILAAGKHYGSIIPWFIMTSELNDTATREYFAANNYLSLGKENVIFIKQESLPAREAGSDNPAMAGDGVFFRAANGHGGLYRAMRTVKARTGGGAVSAVSALREAGMRGIDTFLYCQIDNPTPVIDKMLLGYHSKKHSDHTTVLVRKRSPGEGLGMPAKDAITGEPFVVEYNQPAAGVIRDRNGYEYGSISRFVYSYDFLASATPPPFRYVRNKKAKIFKDGAVTDGLIDKFESLVFDAIGQAKTASYITLDRAECFASFKEMTGEDSPAAVAKAISNLAKRWLAQSGVDAQVSEESTLEFSSAFALHQDDIKGKVGRNWRIEGASMAYLGGREIKIGKNVIIRGRLNVKFEDPYDGSFEVPDNAAVKDADIYVRKGEKLIYGTSGPEPVLSLLKDGEKSYPAKEKNPERAFKVGVRPDESFEVKLSIGVFDVSNGLLAGEIGGKKTFFVVDGGVGKALTGKIKAYTERYGINAHIMVVPGGEDMKAGMRHVYRVIREAEKFGIDRKEMMVLVGGGAVLDMAGFAASILHRGVEHIRIPSTLLAQDDAGVGTKNAVNYAGQKNFLGVFQPPKTVIIDPTILSTLDTRQMRSGMAEVVKVSLIKDRGLFEVVEGHYKDVLNNDLSAGSRMKDIIWGTIMAHLGQICTDPYETKLARPLDYGHEWGHRLEMVTDHRLNHGEAVAVGMAIDTHISYARGYISKNELERTLSLLEAIGLPIYDRSATVKNIWPGLESFRRHLGGELTISLLDGIGGKQDVHTILKSETERAISYLKARVAGKSSGEKQYPAAEEKLPKMIFFDIDGVLLKCPGDRYIKMARRLEDYGVKIAAEELERLLYCYGDKEYEKKVMRGLVSAEEYITYVNEELRRFGLKRDFTPEQLFELRYEIRGPNAKVAAMFSLLKQNGIKFGLLSSRWNGDPAVILKKLNEAYPCIFDDNDLIVFTCDEHLGKDDVELFARARERASRKLGISEDEILFVDDNERVLKTAAQAGLRGLNYVYHDGDAPDPGSFYIFARLLADKGIKAADDWTPLAGLDGKIAVNPNTGRIRYGPEGPVVKSEVDLWVVRHGRTRANTITDVFQGDVDGEMNQLDEVGMRQSVEAAGKLFAALESRIRSGDEPVILSSGLGRSKDTAAAFAKLVKERTGREIPVITDRMTNEISFGVWENKVPRDLSEEDKKLAIRYREHFDANVRPRGGESFADLLIRARKFLDMVNREHKGKTVILFGHGTYIGAMMALLGDKRLVDEELQLNWRSGKRMVENAEPILLASVPASGEKAYPAEEDAYDRIRRIQELKANGEKITMLTAYDAVTARAFSNAGIEMLLVGDSVAMVKYGYPTTNYATMEMMLKHIRMVSEGADRSRTVVIGDMPYRSYDTPEEALASARLMIEAGADAVKMEGGRDMGRIVRALVSAGIPVMGHIGYMPQFGRPRVFGGSKIEMMKLLEDAATLEEAGAFSIVLEMVYDGTAEMVSKHLTIPTIGIGSGNEADGQVLVSNDVLGLTEYRREGVERSEHLEVMPRFVERFTRPYELKYPKNIQYDPSITPLIGEGAIERAGRRFFDAVKLRSYPKPWHYYQLGTRFGRLQALADELRELPINHKSGDLLRVIRKIRSRDGITIAIRCNSVLSIRSGRIHLQTVDFSLDEAIEAAPVEMLGMWVLNQYGKKIDRNIDAESVKLKKGRTAKFDTFKSYHTLNLISGRARIVSGDGKTALGELNARNPYLFVTAQTGNYSIVADEDTEFVRSSAVIKTGEAAKPKSLKSYIVGMPGDSVPPLERPAIAREIDRIFNGSAEIYVMKSSNPAELMAEAKRRGIKYGAVLDIGSGAGIRETIAHLQALSDKAFREAHADIAIINASNIDSIPLGDLTAKVTEIERLLPAVAPASIEALKADLERRTKAISPSFAHANSAALNTLFEKRDKAVSITTQGVVESGMLYSLRDKIRARWQKMDIHDKGDDPIKEVVAITDPRVRNDDAAKRYISALGLEGYVDHAFARTAEEVNGLSTLFSGTPGHVGLRIRKGEIKDYETLRSAIPPLVILELGDINGVFVDTNSYEALFELFTVGELPDIPGVSRDEMRRIFIYVPKAVPIYYDKEVREHQRALRAILSAA
ncbi:MAG: 3-dehydroquinate synthase [Candidatus Omnitrophica bacterium]|nr:3-dehydroquinate synthase [Candidatus Omnitrophota bacterium]